MTAPRVGLLGCGLIGAKRARALGPARLVACRDVQPARAAQLAAQYPGAVVEASAESLLARPDVDLVIIATTNDGLAPLTRAALAAGKHVLVEKPAARRLAELRTVQAVAAASDRLVRVGFNHRYHPAFQRARALIDEGAVGPLMMIRGRYGHGGRLGYEHEWRADPAIAGGGELIDQGVHLIDLAGWLLGDFTQVRGHAGTYFWPMAVEDNAFLLLQTANQQTAWLHVSCSEWKNLFSFEIYGRTGKLQIDGLGGSYGVERLAYYRMKPEMGPPETTIWEYPGEDTSWALEFGEFLEDIRLDRPPAAGLTAAAAALEVVAQIYRESGFADYA